MSSTVEKARERPILFSGPMVRAIMEGRKTQTRRVVKPQPAEAWMLHKDTNWSEYYKRNRWNKLEKYLWIAHPTENKEIVCPYGKPGDRLWVRETFCWKFIDPPGPNGYYGNGYWYAATDPAPMAVDGDGGVKYRKNGEEASPWISGLRMPRKASRITLEITNIRVERLQSISGPDAVAEGVGNKLMQKQFAQSVIARSVAVEEFRQGWDELNGKRGYSFGSNPWVWVIEFAALEGK